MRHRLTVLGLSLACLLVLTGLLAPPGFAVDPAIVGSCSLPNAARDVALAGDLAYVTTFNADLQVVDTGTKAAPRVVGSCSDTYYAQAVAVVGDYAYVAGGSLQVVDVRDPSAPVVVGSCALSQTAGDVAVVGDYAYVAAGFSYYGPWYFQVVDVSDKTKPAVVGSLPMSHAVGVAVVGTHAYVAADGLRVVDVSSPASPVEVGSCALPHETRGIAVAGDRAYVAGLEGLQVVDVTSPAAPALVGSFDIFGYTQGVAVAGDRAYICGMFDYGYTGGLRVLDVSNPAVPVGVGACALPSNDTGRLAVAGTYAYVASGGLLVVDLDPPPPALGVLDPTFGGDGKVVTSLTSGADWATGAALQPDGKIVAVGGAASGKRFGIARYNTDGSLDTSFSGDGRAFVDFTSGYDSATWVAVQTDGKIVVVGGASWGERANTTFAVARLNSDGTLDTGFSGDGKVTTDFTRKEDFANSVLIQPDGKIVVNGPSGVFGTSPKFALARYNSDGSLDATFGVGGKVVTDFTPGTDDWSNSSALQPDGKIVVTGCAGVRADWKFALARYNGDGSLDTSFGVGGMVKTNITRTEDQGSGVAVQWDGKIVVAGTAAQRQTNGKFALARYRTDGSLDTSFSGDGKLTTDFTTKKDAAWHVAIQADGHIVACGYAGLDSSNPTFGLARYNEDGSLDTSFSGDGKLRTDFSPKHDVAGAVLIQSDGRIVVVGECGYGGSNDNIALARYR